MKRLCLLALLSLCSLPARASGTAESAYAKARKDYYLLKRDPARRKYRDNWLKVAHRFDDVARRFPKSDRAVDALYTAAQLYSELSEISRVNDDLEAALKDYRKVITEHPRHHLADDAAFALGKAQLERLERPEEARATLSHALKNYPKADRAKEIRNLLASLPADERPKAAEKSHALAKAHAPAAEETVAKVDATEPKAPAAKHADAPEDSGKHSAKELAQRGHASNPADGAEQGGSDSADASEDHNAHATTTVSHPARAEAKATAAPTQDAEPEVEVAEADEEPAAPAPAPTQASPQTAKARLAELRHTRGGELTLAEQLGLKVHKVVIDAGHGGHDSGAIGPDGTQEKRVSLAIAKKVAKALAAQGLEVVLTRDDDHFVRLEDRARIANEAHGDLFISIHCNSAPQKKLHGIETYTLNTSADRYSIRLAARENSASEKGVSDLQFILADLATKANTDESTRLSSKVQHSLVSELSGHYGQIKDLGNKQALFFVLIGAKMPAILVETSFISNPTEEKRLNSSTYQDQVAQAIADGVEDFLGDRQRVARVP